MLRPIEKPTHGWLRTVREGLGLSLRAVASIPLRISPQALHRFETNEVAGTLTLGNLERVAAAMGCQVKYVLMPAREGQTFAELAAGHSGDLRLVEDVEHTMTLEAQSVGGVAERAMSGIRHGGR